MQMVVLREQEVELSGGRVDGQLMQRVQLMVQGKWIAISMFVLRELDLVSLMHCIKYSETHIDMSTSD